MNVDGLPNTTEIDTKVVAGWDSWAALTRDGHVVASGSNSQGLCSPPGGSSGGVDIAASASSFVALKADGTLVRWGDVGTPYTALPTGKVAAIAGGEVHVLAAVADGTVSAWYADDSGSQATVPAGLTGVVAVAAGDAHSLAAGNGFCIGLRADGSIVHIASGYAAQLPFAAMDIHDAITAPPPTLTRTRWSCARTAPSSAG